MDGRTVLKNRSINLVLLAISGTAGIAALVLPFIEIASPLRAAIEFCPIKGFGLFWQSWLLAIPFFLSVLISAAYARWLLRGPLSRIERVLAYIVSSVMIIGLLYLENRVIISDLEPKFIWWLLGPMWVLMLFICVYILIKNMQNKSANAVMAMQLAYLLNFYVCFIGFFEGLQIGAYFAVVTSTVYLIQITQPSLRPHIVRVEDMSR